MNLLDLLATVLEGISAAAVAVDRHGGADRDAAVACRRLLSSRSEQGDDALSGLPWRCPALYALGCGATLFAGEHEAETYEFQRSLPRRVQAVFVGKIFFAIASTAADVGTDGVAGRLPELVADRAGDASHSCLLAWATCRLLRRWKCSFGRCFLAC